MDLSDPNAVVSAKKYTPKDIKVLGFACCENMQAITNLAREAMTCGNRSAMQDALKLLDEGISFSQEIYSKLDLV